MRIVGCGGAHPPLIEALAKRVVGAKLTPEKVL